MEKGNATLHFLDRYLGVPAILFLGLSKVFKNRLPDFFSPKRVAILNISSIGDNVLMSAPIQDLRTRFPQAEIILFCGNTNYGVAKMLPGLDAVHMLPVTQVLSSAKYIRSFGRFDLMIDFGPWPRLNALLSFFFRAKFKIGFRSTSQFRHYIYDYAVLHSAEKHELDNFRALLAPLHIQAVSDPQLIVPAHMQPPVEKPYLVFHPWPGGYKSYRKEWAVLNWVALAEKLGPLPYTIYITGAAADVEASESLEQKSSGRLKSMAGKLNLTETALLVKNAELLVSVNTGIMHLGAAFDVPLVALHGPTSVKRWGPVSTKAINLFPKGEGCGYLHFGYEYNKSDVDCMALISVEEVQKAIFEQLKAYVN